MRIVKPSNAVTQAPELTANRLANKCCSEKLLATLRPLRTGNHAKRLSGRYNSWPALQQLADSWPDQRFALPPVRQELRGGRKSAGVARTLNPANQCANTSANLQVKSQPPAAPVAAA